MSTDRGFTMFELLVTVAMIAVLSAIGLPVMNEAINRNKVWTATELVGGQIRQARLRAITGNRQFRVRFDCPAASQLRILEVTGNPAIDDAADRCGIYQGLDGGIVAVPANISFGVVPTLEVNGRGVFTAIGGALPLTISVSYGGAIMRTLTVGVTGQITYETF